MKFLGLDVGSVSVKLVVLDEKNNKLENHYIRHKGHSIKIASELLANLIKNSNPNEKFSLSVTGSSGKFIASLLGIKPVNEIVAQSCATQKLYPHIRTVIELGGEDSKLIMLGESASGGSVKEFFMNSVCAAGTGSFLDQQAERLRLSIEDFSELSLKSKNPPKIAGRCSVFAKSDMIHLQQIATPVEDIVAGLCFAVARNFKGSICRGIKIVPPVSFHGGVAANKGMVRAFENIFEIDELFVPPDFAFMVALGAVFKDMAENKINLFDIKTLENFLKIDQSSDAGYKPLTHKGDDFLQRHCEKDTGCRTPYTKYQIQASDISQGEQIRHQTSETSTNAYLGIDIGSISTNLAVTDKAGNLLSKRYLMTAGRPIEAVMQGLREVGDELGNTVKIIGVGTTGSGRYMIADYVGADIVKNEITAQATAAAFIDKNVDTIFEIGGQDSKYISLRDGVIVDFEMNKACAAGTGSFLEEQAEKLNIAIKDEFASSALSAKNPCRLGERCTVFMENSLMSKLQKGADRNDLLAGLAYSIVQNYINRVVAGKHIGKNIFFQGGVAFNKSVVAAFEKYLDTKITVPPHHDVTGAIGMALIARDYMAKKNSASSFKGFELSKRKYDISSFECKGCSNVCEINRVKMEGEESNLFYGGRCERYDVKKNKTASTIPNLFAFREEMLWKSHNEYKNKSTGNKTKIGIPYIFYFHEYLPFWTTLLWELGFDVEISSKTNRQITNLGLESNLAETCFPIKVAYGHLKQLLNSDVDTVLIPSFVNLGTDEKALDRGLACPLTQTVPYVSKVALDVMNLKKVSIISPVMNVKLGEKFLINELFKKFRQFGIKKNKIEHALEKAESAQKEFRSAVQSKGAEILSSLNNLSLVIVGRAYNSFDNGMNLEMPKKTC